MAEVFDIKLQGFDLVLKDGDFEIAESTVQHQDILLVSAPGNLMQNPDKGVDALGYMNDDENLGTLRKAIQKNFEADGMSITRIEVRSASNIDIEAQY